MKPLLTCILKPRDIVKILKRYRINNASICHQSKSFPVNVISIISSNSTMLVFIDFVCNWISHQYNKKKDTSISIPYQKCPIMHGNIHNDPLT